MNDKKNRSFGCYRKNPFDEETLKEWFRISEKEIPWDQPNVNGKPLPRKAAFFVSSSECNCHYRYSDTKWKPHPYPDWFMKITEAVCEKVGLDFTKMPNACNVNLYLDGTQSVGWHSDNEPLFESTIQDCCIISLSLGAPRKFQFQFQHQGTTQEVELCNGDIMTMEGLFQRYYSHRVPRQNGCKKPRINFTWRFVTRHYSDKDNCPLNREAPGVAGHNFKQHFYEQRFGNRNQQQKQQAPPKKQKRTVELPIIPQQVEQKIGDRFDPNGSATPGSSQQPEQGEIAETAG